MDKIFWKIFCTVGLIFISATAGVGFCVSSCVYAYQYHKEIFDIVLCNNLGIISFVIFFLVAIPGKEDK